MISFIWSASAALTGPVPLVAMQGGTERYTLGQCRELTRRGVANRVVTFGMGKADGREYATGVSFVDYPGPREFGRLDDRSFLVGEPLDLDADSPPYQILHKPPSSPRLSRQQYRRAVQGRRLIVPSRAAARMWGEYLGAPPDTLGVVYPFADRCFSRQPAPPRTPGPVRVLFAGRLGVEKGVYTLLEALHYLVREEVSVTVLLAGAHGDAYPLVAALLRAHPMVSTAPERDHPQLAELLVTQDVLVMPSRAAVWPEPFGMLSVEAQHAGCRVVAADCGGLPETDCGGLVRFEPDNPLALARAIRRAGRMGRLRDGERAAAARSYTVEQSVDQLLAVLAADLPVYGTLPAVLRGER